MKNKENDKVRLAAQVGILAGDALAQNSHAAVDAMVEGMDLFRDKVQQISNVPFDIAKGNLFEYIEAAKFNANAAWAKAGVKAVVTDAAGDPHAAADILIQKGNKTVQEVQAKAVQTFKDGRDTSAASVVFDQAGGQSGHWGKYHGMQRLIRKDEHYNEDGSLLDEAKKLSKTRADANGMHSEEYRDVHENLTDELHYKDVSSGGTTMEELEEAYHNPERYSRRLERRQLTADMMNTAKTMAVTGAISGGIVSGVRNAFLVLRDEKDTDAALKEVGIDAAKGAARGGVTGVASTAIRFAGKKQGIGILSDSSAATVIAGGMLDGGVAIYSYASGEITGEELRKSLVDTTVKSVSTVYFTKAIGAVFGSVNPFLPMAIFTAASCVVSCTRAIIENARLNAQEYDRMRSLLEESTQLTEQYRQEMNRYLTCYETNQRQIMQELLDSFEYNLQTGANYDTAIFSIVKFANQTGLALQHADFSDFKEHMNSGEGFVLKRRDDKCF